MSIPDLSTDFGRYVNERLRTDPLIWLTTVGAKSRTPIPSLVWFGWDGTEFLVLSQPEKPKLGNITQHPRVSLHLQSDDLGMNVVVFSGDARVDEPEITEAEWEAYARKYADDLPRIGRTAEEYRATFSVPIRVRPDRLRGFH